MTGAGIGDGFTLPDPIVIQSQRMRPAQDLLLVLVEDTTPGRRVTSSMANLNAAYANVFQLDPLIHPVMGPFPSQSGLLDAAKRRDFG